MVARRRRLPGLRPQLLRRERRRNRRPGRRPGAPAVPPRPRRRRSLVQPVVPVAAGGHRVRHRRLPGDRSRLRDAPGGAGADRRGARARDSHHRRHRSEPRLEPASVVHRRTRVTAGLAGAGAVLVPSRDRHGRGAAAERLAVDLRRPGVDPRRGRRVVPPPLRPRAARSQLDASRRLARARGHPSLLVRPRRRRRPHRLGGAARQGPGARRGPGGRSTGRRAPVHGPRHAPRDLPQVAADRRQLCRAAGPRRRDLAARRGAVRAVSPPGRAAHRVQLRLPVLSVGARADAHVDRDRARRPRSRRRADDVGALESRRDAAGHALRPRRHRVRVRVEACRDADRSRARDAARPGGGAARDGAPGLAVRLPGRGARPAGGRGHSVRAPPGSDVAPLRRCRPRARRLPHSAALDGRPPAVRLQPRGRGSRVARPARRLGAAHRRGRVRGRRVDALAVPRRTALRRTAPWSPDGALTWLSSPDSVLAFARGGGFACLVNFGAAPVELPAGSRVVLASDELEGGAVPQDTTVWLRQTTTTFGSASDNKEGR